MYTKRRFNDKIRSLSLFLVTQNIILTYYRSIQIEKIALQTKKSVVFVTTL